MMQEAPPLHEVGRGTFTLETSSMLRVMFLILQLLADTFHQTVRPTDKKYE